jgi:hypothetical protein
MTAKQLISVTVAGLAAVLALAGCDAAQNSTETHRYTVQEQVDRLVLKSDAGRVEIVVGDGPITVTEVYRYSKNPPAATHTVNERVLRLADGDCPHQHFGQCSVDYSVRVPAATAVEITADAGTVQVTGLSGDLTVTSDAGRVEATGLASEHTKVTADAGRVSLAYRQPPASVDVQADAGTVEVILPTGDSYAVDATTDAGRVTVEVPQDKAAPRTITAHSDAGAVQIVNG